MTIGHEVIGTGSEKIMVLHGWFGDHSVFEPMYNSLDLETFSYGFVNYRGYGKSRDMPGDHTMSEIAADAIALADELGWDRFHSLGHSMGGMAVQRLALDAPGRTKSMICLTPVPASGAPLDEESHALFHGAPDNDGNRRGIIDFTSGNRLSGAWLDFMVKASRETTTRDAFADYLVAWTETNFMEEVQGLDVPTLALVGEHDLAITADVMKQTYMEWLANVNLQVLANAGHYPMQETPVYLAAVMEEFFKKNV